MKQERRRITTCWRIDWNFDLSLLSDDVWAYCFSFLQFSENALFHACCPNSPLAEICWRAMRRTQIVRLRFPGRRFYSHNWPLTRSFGLTEPTELSDEELAKQKGVGRILKLAAKCHNISRIEFCGSNVDSLFDEGILHLLNNSPQVTSLVIPAPKQDCCDAILKCISSHMTELQTLKLTNHNNYVSYGLGHGSYVGRENWQLSSLEDISKCSKLETLRLELTDHVDHQKGMFLLLDNLRFLKRCQIICKEDIFTQCIPKLTNPLTQLVRLDLTQMRISTDGCHNLAICSHLFPALRELSISPKEHEGWKKLVNSCLNLTRLYAGRFSLGGEDVKLFEDKNVFPDLKMFKIGWISHRKCMEDLNDARPLLQIFSTLGHGKVGHPCNFGPGSCISNSISQYYSSMV